MLFLPTWRCLLQLLLASMTCFVIFKFTECASDYCLCCVLKTFIYNVNCTCKQNDVPLRKRATSI
jgi:hypothetical protein